MCEAEAPAAPATGPGGAPASRPKGRRHTGPRGAGGGAGGGAGVRVLERATGRRRCRGDGRRRWMGAAGGGAGVGGGMDRRGGARWIALDAGAAGEHLAGGYLDLGGKKCRGERNPRREEPSI